jgi:Flp pilus assembly protein TadG
VRRRRNERGASAVEFALVLPIMLMLVLGIIDFGLMIHEKTMLANAAREGARNGAISRNEAVIRQTVAGSLVGPAQTQATVTVTCVKANGTACAGSFDTQVEPGGKVVVTVEDTYEWITPISRLVGLGTGVDLEKTVEMRVE